MDTPESLGVEGIIPPPGGWKKKSYYVVDVAYTPVNLIHRAIVYKDFGKFVFWNGSYENAGPRKVYYMKFIEEIKSMGGNNG